MKMGNTARKGVSKTVRTAATYQKIIDRQAARLNETIADLIADGFTVNYRIACQIDATLHSDPYQRPAVHQLELKVEKK